MGEGVGGGNLPLLPLGIPVLCVVHSIVINMKIVRDLIARINIFSTETIEIKLKKRIANRKRNPLKTMQYNTNKKKKLNDGKIRGWGLVLVENRSRR